MKKELLFSLLLIPNILMASETEKFCNKLGGSKGDNFYSYQFCDFLTGKPVTPLHASTEAIAKSHTGLKSKDGHWQSFELSLYQDKVVITKNFNSRSYGKPIILSAQGSIDNGSPFDFELVNYGFGERVGFSSGVVRESVVQGATYSKLLDQIKNGKIMKVLWIEKDLAMGTNVTFSMEFSLKDSEKFITYISKDSFTF
ncbi:hypothetical protein ABZP26_17450 [Pseudoalteromonas sp. SD03]|jgi:hypothetical protein|uniref:Uncharacterized protein n=1 Tax=Pseudoalteromonas sp. SD03 TaxID=3231719 RepID=A0AB39AW12_9GAMM